MSLELMRDWMMPSCISRDSGESDSAEKKTSFAFEGSLFFRYAFASLMNASVDFGSSFVAVL